MKVGDNVGQICKRKNNDVEEWHLYEDKINKIVELKKGKTYYTKSKFRPLDAEDVDRNTEQQERASGKGYILTNEVFGLNNITRPFVEKWIIWANENIDKAVSLI